MDPRPDFSDYVVHFTKDAAPICRTAGAPGIAYAGMSAKDRLFNILTQRSLTATRMPWTNLPAICFTECTWTSLFSHANQYSRYGIGFRKDFLFAAGGGPAIYMPPALLTKQKAYVGAGKAPFDSDLYAFLTPFAPSYMPSAYKLKHWTAKKPVDYSHEREWRVPHNLSFDYSRVAFVIVDTYKDMAQAPEPLKDATGRENWLIMSNWERVEELWPVHHIP